MYIRKALRLLVSFWLGYFCMKGFVDTISATSVETSTVITKQTSYILNKDSIDQYPLAEVMSAVAYHECFNLSKLERWLIMEAFHNRLVNNFNNNGTTVKEQLLAPKQFTGLWKYSPQQFKYDSNDTLSIQNRQMAELIIDGSRVSTVTVYYWAGICDATTAHGKWVKKQCLKLPTHITHIFR